MITIPVGQADGQLSNLVHALGPNDQIALTENGRMVARIVAEPAPFEGVRVPGLCKGMLEIVGDDDGDDEVLAHFAAYLP